MKVLSGVSTNLLGEVVHIGMEDGVEEDDRLVQIPDKDALHRLAFRQRRRVGLTSPPRLGRTTCFPEEQSSTCRPPSHRTTSRKLGLGTKLTFLGRAILRSTLLGQRRRRRGSAGHATCTVICLCKIKPLRNMSTIDQTSKI